MLELEAMDPDTERFNTVESGMSDLLKCYREMSREKEHYKIKLISFLSSVRSRTTWRYNFYFIAVITLTWAVQVPDNQINNNPELVIGHSYNHENVFFLVFNCNFLLWQWVLITYSFTRSESCLSHYTTNAYLFMNKFEVCCIILWSCIPSESSLLIDQFT